MDGKKTDTEKSVKRAITNYLSTYLEDLPKSKDELIKDLPKYLKSAIFIAANTFIGYLFGSITLAYSSIPLGHAYLVSAKKYAFFVYLGLLICLTAFPNIYRSFSGKNFDIPQHRYG